MPEAVRMDDVRLSLGETGFSFDCALQEGAITAVTGASGSGKSTFLNLISGFEQADSGQISILGRNVTRSHPSERPVSLVFQDNNLFAHLDILTNIGLGIDPAMRLSAEDRRRISGALERTGLAGFERRKPGTLSGGERQRVAFARALVRNRPLLLLDEPFAALDRDLRHGMAELLLELHRETGNTVVIVSHDQQEVTRLADQVISIDHGQIAAIIAHG